MYRGGIHDRSGARLGSVSQEIVMRTIQPEGIQRVADFWNAWLERQQR